MKKIFGIMSLIAILAVTFTLQANPSQEVNKQGVVFDVGDGVSVAVAVQVVDTAVFEPNFEVSRWVEVAQGNSYSPISIANFVDLRIDPGSNSERFIINENANSQSSYKNSQRKSSGAGNGYNGLHEPVGWNS